MELSFWLLLLCRIWEVCQFRIIIIGFFGPTGRTFGPSAFFPKATLLSTRASTHLDMSCDIIHTLKLQFFLQHNSVFVKESSFIGRVSFWGTLLCRGHRNNSPTLKNYPRMLYFFIWPFPCDKFNADWPIPAIFCLRVPQIQSKSGPIPSQFRHITLQLSRCAPAQC